MASRQTGRARSADGVEIAYSHSGGGDISLLFIHGGLANRAFWELQFAALAGEFRLAALDLAGHGESGRNREHWAIAAFADDARAVSDALGLRNIVLVGNSLGGPVALEAAARLRGRAIGVVGVDTLQAVGATFPPEEARSRASAYRADFRKSCTEMCQALFHPGAHPDLQAWALTIMLTMDQEVVARIMEGLSGYDLGAAVRAAGVPIRAINGDLWPTDLDGNRALSPGFDAVILANTGHYPMLERPAEFNGILTDMVRELAAAGGLR